MYLFRCKDRFEGGCDRDRGFTLIETLMALLFLTLFIVTLLGIMYLGISRVGTVEVDGKMVRFEQSILRYVEQDFRENRILSIGDGDLPNEKLVIVAEDVNGDAKTILYENRCESDDCF